MYPLTSVSETRGEEKRRQATNGDRFRHVRRPLRPTCFSFCSALLCSCQLRVNSRHKCQAKCVGSAGTWDSRSEEKTAQVKSVPCRTAEQSRAQDSTNRIAYNYNRDANWGGSRAQATRQGAEADSRVDNSMPTRRRDAARQ